MHTAMALESERKRGEERERGGRETDTEKHRQNWPAVSCLACIRDEHTHFLLALRILLFLKNSVFVLILMRVT